MLIQLFDDCNALSDPPGPHFALIEVFPGTSQLSPESYWRNKQPGAFLVPFNVELPAEGFLRGGKVFDGWDLDLYMIGAQGTKYLCAKLSRFWDGDYWLSTAHSGRGVVGGAAEGKALAPGLHGSFTWKIAG